MIGIIDYGAGNIMSLQNALSFLGYESKIIKEDLLTKNMNKIILPGVGAFPDAVCSLKKSGLFDDIKKFVSDGGYILGICLGMQLLFEKSEEVQVTEGFGFIEGDIKKICCTKKIPHMGWNDIYINKKCALLEGVRNGSYMYFVHSYYACTNDENIYADCEYGIKIPAAVCRDKIYGLQFHPEKSGESGLRILKNFGELI